MRPGEFLAGSIPNTTAFNTTSVGPPSSLYIQRDDVLVVQASSSSASEVVTINGRLLLANMPRGGQPDNAAIDPNIAAAASTSVIVPIAMTIRPGATRTVTTQTFQLAEGYLLSLGSLAAIAITRGQTFVRAFISRGGSALIQPSQLLFADYVTTQIGAAYPNGRVTAPIEGPGFVYLFAGTNPGAGANWSVSVPANARWRVRSIGALLTTSATVINRQVGLHIAVGGNIVFTGAASVAIPANTPAVVTAVALNPFAPLDTTRIYLPLPPDLYLTGASGLVQTISSEATNLQAGDQWSSINLLVEEWLDNI
jgi:hypothetical protein